MFFHEPYQLIGFCRILGLDPNRAKWSSSWVWVGARAMPTGKNLQFPLQGTILIIEGDMKGILRVDLLKNPECPATS